jgi:hypothetical protein
MDPDAIFLQVAAGMQSHMLPPPVLVHALDFPSLPPPAAVGTPLQ